MLIRSNFEVAAAKTWSYIEINQVLSQNENVLDLKYPIRSTVVSPFLIYAGIPLPTTIPNVPRDILRSAIVRDLAFHSEFGTWCARTGFFECVFENLTILKSTNVIYGNAMAHSVLRNITGTFCERGIELATACSDVLIDSVDIAYRKDGSKVLETVVGIQGFSRRVNIDHLTLSLNEQVVTGTVGTDPVVPIPSIGVRIDGEDNILQNSTLYFRKIDLHGVAFAASAAGAICRRNRLLNTTLWVDSLTNRYVQFGAAASGEPVDSISDNVVQGCQFLGPVGNEAVSIDGGVRNSVLDNYFEQKNIKVDGGTGHIVSRNRLVNGKVTVATASVARVEENSSSSVLTLADLRDVDISLANSPKTDSLWTAWKTYTVPMGILLSSDVIRLRWSGKVTGTTGAKYLRFKVGTVVVGTKTIPLATQGAVEGILDVTIISGSAQRAHAKVTDPTSVVTDRQIAAVVLSTTDLILSIDGYVDTGASNSVTIDLITLDFERLYEI